MERWLPACPCRNGGDRQREKDESVHGAGHPDVAETAFFLDGIRLKERTGVGKEAFFHTAQKDERKLEALGGVKGHQRDLGALVVSISVADQGGVIEKLVERFAAIFESMAALTSSRRFSMRE